MKKILTLSLVFFSFILHANIIYVNGSATGLNNGTTWTDAYTNLQSALTTAQSGDQIWVARGVYKPSVTDTTVSFVVNGGISLYGGFIGEETNLSQRKAFCNKTILSGDLLDNDTIDIATHFDNSVNVLNIISQSLLIIIDGFTIQGAFSNNALDSLWQIKRGGVYVWSSGNVKISNCTIKDNSSYAGSGIAIYGSSADITNCIVTGNYANDDAGGMDFAFDGVINVKNCLISNNLCDDIGGAAGSGSGIRIVHSAGSGGYPDIYNFENCTIANNMANSSSTIGGVCITNNYARARFKNCIIYGNANIDIGSRQLETGVIDQLNNCVVGVNYSSLTATFSANPQFVSGTDFRLSSTSPYIDAGINALSTTIVDLNNGSRINNGTIDLGAFEFGNASPDCSSLETPQISNINSQISIFPNPAKEYITIQLANQNSENITATIYNSIGQKVKTVATSTSNKITISVEELSNGVYFVSLSGMSSNALKFIKI